MSFVRIRPERVCLVCEGQYGSRSFDYRALDEHTVCCTTCGTVYHVDVEFPVATVERM